MGRLLRKKPDDKKKKKKKDELEALPSASSGSETASPVKSVKKIDTMAVKKPAPSIKANPLTENSFINKSIQFLREVKVELKKVTWPSRTQTVGSTAVVLILVMIISFFLGIADMGLSSLFRLIMQ